MPNINDIFPRLPIGGNDYSLLDKFRREILPLNQGRVADVGTRLAQPMQHQEMQQTRADFHDNAPLRPGYTPPDMNVVYKPPMSDQIATRMLGIGNGAVTPLDERELALKGQAIDATVAKNDAADKLGQAKLGVSQDRADVYRFKAENPGLMIVAPKGGNIKAINRATGQTVRDFGPAGTLADADRIALEQDNSIAKIAAQGKNNESLADVQARHAIELANAKKALDTGNTTNTSVTDANGKVVGTRTATTKPNAPAPKKGDKKTFPNGVKAVFDGTGWLPEAK